MTSKPELLLFNETKMHDEEPRMQIPGYQEVSKKNRDSHGGGVAIFACTDKITRFSELEVSATHERIWILIHTDEGPLLLGCWYRPPREPLDGIARFQEELKRLRAQAVGTIVIGDLNVHSRRWLTHSAGESAEGKYLQEVCVTAGLQQLVREPTRECMETNNKYLLDLVMTDMPEVIVSVGQKVRDHNSVLATVEQQIPISETLVRKAWNFKKADWLKLREALGDTDWEFLKTTDPNVGAQQLTASILEHAESSIGRRIIREVKSTHPWMNERIKTCLAEKHAAEGTERERETTLSCSEAIRTA